MEGVIAILVAPIIIFMIFVAPLWIIFHYTRRGRTTPESAAEDRQLVEELLAIADKMENRIKSLEAILDKDHPGWRKDYE